MLTILEAGAANSGITDAQVTALQGSLQSYGAMMLDNFIKLLPALVILSAIGFVIGIIRKKAKA